MGDLSAYIKAAGHGRCETPNSMRKTFDFCPLSSLNHCFAYSAKKGTGKTQGKLRKQIPITRGFTTWRFLKNEYDKTNEQG